MAYGWSSPVPKDGPLGSTEPTEGRPLLTQCALCPENWGRGIDKVQGDEAQNQGRKANNQLSKDN